MNNRLLSVIGFAVVISTVASFAVYRLISARLVANARPPTSNIVVASRNLEVGTLIRSTDLAQSEWTGPMPKGAFSNPQDALGRGVVAAIYSGEPILDTRVAAKGAGAGLAATIPPGMRAVALRVNEVVGVAGFVTPGMRVDVLIAGTPPNNKSPELGTRTKTLLQNIEVLSAGQNIQKDAEGKPVPVAVVNVLVTPEQAEILSLASNETRIQLVLRNPMDTEQSKTRGTTLASLFKDSSTESPAGPEPAHPPARRVAVKPPPPQDPIPVAKAPERVYVPVIVEVIHGARKTETRFQEEQVDETAPEVTPR